METLSKDKQWLVRERERELGLTLPDLAELCGGVRKDLEIFPRLSGNEKFLDI